MQALSSIPRIAANGPDDAYDSAHIATVNKALKGPGIAILDLGFRDADSQYLQNNVLSLGEKHKHGPPITHSATQGWFWDVKPKQISTCEPQARSEGKLEFPWHTDCSYETRPPQFLALHVLRADRNGGGTLSVVNLDEVIRKIGPATLEVLSRPEFRIKVPTEFDRGIDSIVGSLVSRSDSPAQTRIRFRADIIQPLTKDAESALDELNRLLGPGGDVADIMINITPEHLPDNAIVLMDNGRWLHSRNEVKDGRRHLRRIRWDRRDFGSGDANKAETRAEQREQAVDIYRSATFLKQSPDNTVLAFLPWLASFSRFIPAQTQLA